MRIFINEYTKVLAYTFIGLLFAYCSFFFILNIYHYQEVRKTYNINIQKNEDYKSIIKNIDLIKDNIDVDVDNYNGSSNKLAMFTLQKNINSCLDDIDNNYLKSLKNKKSVDIKDAEKMKTVLVNDVINLCLIEKLYYVTYNNDDIKFLQKDAALLKSNIDGINVDGDFINKNIGSNSSLYFTTFDSSNNIYSKVGNNYEQLLNIYKRSTDVFLTISSKFGEEVRSND